MHNASLSPVLRSAINRHKPLSPDDERATATAIWLARCDAWRLVLDDPTARSRAVAVLEAYTRADREGAPSREKDRRALLDALATGDPKSIALADKDDAVLRLAVAEVAPRQRPAVRSCLTRLDAAVARIERHNVALVVHVARKCFALVTGGGGSPSRKKSAGKTTLASAIEIDDLVAWGCEGLRTAVLRFDPARGLRFSTFSVWWIRHGIGRALADHRHTIRVPVHLHETVVKIRRAVVALEATGTVATDESVAERLNLDPRKVAEARRAMRLQVATSLSKPVGSGDGGDESSMETLADLIADPDADHASDFADADEHRKRMGAVMRSLDRLDERDQFIVDARFGLSRDADEPDILEDVGAVLGVSRERVRQLQRAAVQQIREAVGATIRA